MLNSGRENGAVLLFTRTALEEARAKDFSRVHNIRANTHIADQLIHHSESVARRSGLPCFIIRSDAQEGHTFGERLANSIEAVFQKGYSHVIAIGNDCPGLRSDDLLEADARLRTNSAVLGPSDDGGLYLIGIQRKYFHRESFASLHWSSADTCEALKGYFEEMETSCCLFEIKPDIDLPEQLAACLHDSRIRLALRLFLQSILASLAAGFAFRGKFPLSFRAVRNRSLRAPPSFSFC